MKGQTAAVTAQRINVSADWLHVTQEAHDGHAVWSSRVPVLVLV